MLKFNCKTFSPVFLLVNDVEKGLGNGMLNSMLDIIFSKKWKPSIFMYNGYFLLKRF